MELVSIIVPIYNVEKYLPKCIESLVVQTYSELEIILVDDGSTDGSGAIIDNYQRQDKRIYAYHTENYGVSHARNYGISKISGSYVCFVDSDDYLDRNAIEVRINLLNIHQADICAERFIFMDEKKYLYADIEKGLLNSDDAIHKLLHFQYPNSLWAGMYRTEFIKNVSFDEDIHFWEDLKYQFEVISQSNKVIVSDIPVYHYIKREGSANTWPINDKVMSCLLIPDKMKDLIISRVNGKDDFISLCSILYRRMFDIFLKQEEEPDDKYFKEFQAFSRKYLFLILLPMKSFAQKRRFIFCCFAFKRYYQRFRCMIDDK